MMTFEQLTQSVLDTRSRNDRTKAVFVMATHLLSEGVSLRETVSQIFPHAAHGNLRYRFTKEDTWETTAIAYAELAKGGAK